MQCFISSQSCSLQPPPNPARSEKEACRGHTRHTLTWHKLSRTHSYTRSMRHAWPPVSCSTRSHSLTFSFSRTLQLFLVMFREQIEIQKRQNDKRSSFYWSINHPSDYQECSVLHKHLGMKRILRSNTFILGVYLQVSIMNVTLQAFQG